MFASLAGVPYTQRKFDMPTTYLPRNNSECDLIQLHISAVLCSDAVDPTFVSLERMLFSEARQAYVVAREAWQLAYANVCAASATAQQINVTFGRDFRCLTGSIRDGEGRLQPRVVSNLLGGVLPGELLRLSPKEEVQRVRGLLHELGGRSDLGYDPAAMEALKASTVALQDATLARTEANTALLSAGVTLSEAHKAFDEGYRRLLGAVRSTLGDAAAVNIFPRFTRTRRTTGTEGDTPVTPSAPAP